MNKKYFRFSQSFVDYHFAAAFSSLKNLVNKEQAVIITDKNVFKHHQAKFKGWNTIVLKAGEEYKVQATVDSVIEQLIKLEADRQTTLVGVGGGVITDLTGYIASIYMRGVSFGFVPTTLLALVDASIGGKNGIDVGVYKNMVGTIKQPEFILHDIGFLNSLPKEEWINGFAEIIKHAAIKDESMFKELEAGSIDKYRKSKTKLLQLVERNVLLKTKIVQQDEFEQGDRKLLNFGHTLGHALENQYELSHGQAISIGMAYAGLLSSKITEFKNASRIIFLLEAYGLPALTTFDKKKVMQVLKMDKKRSRNSINFILLEKIGAAVVEEISLKQLQDFFDEAIN